MTITEQETHYRIPMRLCTPLQVPASFPDCGYTFKKTFRWDSNTFWATVDSQEKLNALFYFVDNPLTGMKQPDCEYDRFSYLFQHNTITLKDFLEQN